MSSFHLNKARRASKCLFLSLALAGAGFPAGCQSTHSTHERAVHSADTVDQSMPAAAKSWQRLEAGNDRYARDVMEHPAQSPDRIREVAKGQHPFAIILSCSDSRIPPELVFDAGVGDLFVIRVAGNTADAAAIGSIEYGAAHLGAPLLVVLGHQRCGAVQAALSSLDADASNPHPGHLDAFINPIVPAAKLAQQTGGDDVPDLAVRENVRRVVEQLTHSQPVLAELVHARKLTIIGAVYNLDTARITPLPLPANAVVP